MSGFFGKRNISRIEVAIEPPDEIYARTPVPIKVSIVNTRRFLPAFLIVVASGKNRLLFPYVDPKKSDTKYLNITFDKRGLHALGDIFISSIFPFNFFIRYKRTGLSPEAVVFPKPRKTAGLSIPVKDKKNRGEKPSNRPGFEADILSLRRYVYGDPLKYIHWKASARTGRLTTKELSSLSHHPVVIDMDNIGIRNIEEKVAAAAYIILKLLRQGTPVGLKAGQRIYAPETSRPHKLAMMKELAFYGKR